MSFTVISLDDKEFQDLYGLNDKELSDMGVHPYICDSNPGFPCRVSLEDAELGARVLLLNYTHQRANTPYKSSHALFVIDGATSAKPKTGEIPEFLKIRQLSVRAFDANDLMTDARVISGSDAEGCFNDLLGTANNSYLHVHNAARGCFLATVNRA